MQRLKIVGLCILAAVGYGVVHDQVTVRICLEYFTIGHPLVFPTDDPTVLALGWGVIATWWAGLICGIPLAIAAREGSRPKRDAASLVRPVLTLLAVMAAFATVAGLVGYTLAERGQIRLVPELAEVVPDGKHSRFLADLWTHLASYLVGFLGGLVVIVRVWRSRGRPEAIAAPARVVDPGHTPGP